MTRVGAGVTPYFMGMTVKREVIHLFLLDLLLTLLFSPPGDLSWAAHQTSGIQYQPPHSWIVTLIIMAVL